MQHSLTNKFNISGAETASTSTAKRPQNLKRSTSSGPVYSAINKENKAPNSNSKPVAAPRNLPSPRIEHDYSPSFTHSTQSNSSTPPNLSMRGSIDSDTEERYVTDDQMKEMLAEKTRTRLVEGTGYRPRSVSPRVPRRSLSRNSSVNDDVYENSVTVNEGGVLKAQPAPAPRRRSLQYDTGDEFTNKSANEDDEQDVYENSRGEFNIGVSSRKDRTDNSKSIDSNQNAVKSNDVVDRQRTNHIDSAVSDR